MNTFNHALESAFFWTLQTSLYATALIALVFAIQFCFGKTLAPRWRHALSLLVVLRLMLPVVPQSSLSLFNLFHRTTPSANVTVPYEPPTATSDLSPQPVLEAAAPMVLPPEPDAARPVSHALRFGPSLKFIWLAGFVAMMLIVTRQHRRFVLESRRWGAVTDPRALGLLDECRNVIGIQRPLSILAATGLNTPALFGFWNPRLLMPQELLAKLTDQELRHVFLHELLHLRRGDVLVNWAMILLRAVHWFNPAVWLAFRRLRADQELACDAAVMSRLAAPERRHYGSTLIKLLEDFSAQALCPGVVPFVTNKQVIKRRISMIAKFKPAGRLAILGSFAIVGLLGIATFTRASSQSIPPAQSAGMAPTAQTINEQDFLVAASPGGGSSSSSSGTSQSAASQSAQEAYAAAMRKQDDRIRDQERMVAALRMELGIVDSPGSGNFGPTVSPEQQASMLQLSNIKVQAEMDAAKQETQLAMLKQIQSSDTARFKNLLPRVTSDAILVNLLQELLTVEGQLSYQLGTMGAEHPDVKRNAELKGKLEAQIKEQVAAIMQAQELAVETLRAQAKNAEKQMAELKARGSALAAESRPYWEAKAELDRMRRMREVIDLRKAQEQGDFQTPSNPGNDRSAAIPGVPKDVLTRYQEAQDLLAEARSAYKRQQFNVPAESLLLTPYRRRVDQFEHEVAGFEKAYPQLAAGGMPGLSSQISAAPLRVVVQSDGTIRLGSSPNPVTLEQFKSAIAKEREKNPQMTLLLRSDSSVSYSAIKDILDVAQKAGITSIGLTTDPLQLR
jgi:bla regulator protein blaR1